MICTPGQIRTQLPTDSYARLHRGRTSAADWASREVQCLQCKSFMKASSLQTHLVSQHEVYQVVTVPADYLVPRPAMTYKADPKYNGRLPCPIPGCPGEHKDGWMLRHHFWGLHPFDRVIVPKEGHFPRCEWCLMQVNPSYPRHDRTKECQVGMDRRLQRESAIESALALHCDFVIHVHGDVFERVEVFKYLGHLLVQSDDDAKAIRQQMRKARGAWARVEQVLPRENAEPRVATKLYKAVVQAILLYGSETWPHQGRPGTA
jgi:hypothetical protein